MAITVKEVAKIIKAKVPGSTACGAGLYLKITPEGNASWQFRFQIDGKRRMMGLGACADVTLADAIAKAADNRKLVRQGIDPLAAKQAAKASERAGTVTFKSLADDYIKDHRSGWRNEKHAQQWVNTLAQYAHPKIGDLALDAIGAEHVLAIIKPIWQKIPETANRVRNRIELVLDAAAARGLRTGQNPAAWRGHLDKLLPKRAKASKAHHAAMPYADVPRLVQRLHDERDSLSALALELTILTACRTSEVLLADWREFDVNSRMWAIPAARMKAGEVHRVPLTAEMLAILDKLPTRSGWLFPGARKGRPLSNMSMTMCLRKIGHADITVHGFRSSFRDWCAEETHYPNIVAEQALAHTISSEVEAAYRRGDLLEKRRSMMQDWSAYCTTRPSANVVPIKSTTAA